MKTGTAFVIIIFSAACSTTLSLVNNSNDQRIPSEHFDRCILALDFKKLIPEPKYNQESVLFEYHPEVRDSSSCNGVYYYRYVSRSFRSALYRDSSGERYSLYHMFVIIDQSIYPLARMNKKERLDFFYQREDELIRQYGEKPIAELKPFMLNGARRFY